jgi:hypothetical protein
MVAKIGQLANIAHIHYGAVSHPDQLAIAAIQACVQGSEVTRSEVG